MIKLLIVLHKLDVPLQDVFADFALLGIALMVAVITDKPPFVLGEGLASQGVSAAGTDEAVTMVGAFISGHVLDGAFNEVFAGYAAFGVVSAVAVFADLRILRKIKNI